ncbi:MAG: HAD hydrolase family protein [Acidobacteriota bacterium]|nr:HAD hydrolase family protein [Acidobacteriota bacterium]
MATLSKDEFARRAAEIEWLLLDVDGVLTDGSLYYGPRGPSLLRFNVRDGLGIRLAQRAGLKVGVLSGRESRALERRADELDLEPVLSGSLDKAGDFETFLDRQSLRARQVAFVGDDLNDLVVLGRCGLSFAPADAAPEVRAVVQAVLETPGGYGAVRELIERLLRARGEWDRALAPFSFEEQ